MVEKSEIKKSFPELKWIKDEKLRDQVVDVWKRAVDFRGWKSLDDIPFTLLFENSGRLVDHTRRVANLAKIILDSRNEDLNGDHLIAGALLHDVGKVVEYEEKNGKVIKSEYGEIFRHPVSGSKLAWECGLPDEVVLIIYAHSHEGDKCKRSAESIIVHHCDFIDFGIRKSLA